MYGKSNMETYITIIDGEDESLSTWSQQNLVKGQL